MTAPFAVALALLFALGVGAWLLRLTLAERAATGPRASRRLIAGGLAGTWALMAGAGMVAERSWEVSDSVQAAWRTAFESDDIGYEVVGDPALAKWASRPQAHPPRPPLDDHAAFTGWQYRLRTALSDLLFDSAVASVPGPVHVREISRTTLEGGLVRVSLDFRSFDGTRIPAVLFVPGGTGQRAAVVVVPGHAEEGIAATVGETASYQHAAALRLAQEGYVVLTFELRGFGVLGARVGADHRIVAYNAILAGDSYKGLVLRDMKRAVDLVAARPDVDARRLAVAGTSLGGELAVTYAAVDLRVGAVVVQAYGGSVGPTPGELGRSEEDQPHYCHTIPGQNRLMHEEDVFLLVAPRPMLIVRGTRDIPLLPEFGAILHRAYAGSGSDHSLWLRTPRGGHEFFLAPAVEFLTAAFEAGRSKVAQN